MKLSEIILNCYQYIWKDIADAFDDINWVEDYWGKTFEWINVNVKTNLDLNFGLIIDHSPENALSGKKWLMEKKDLRKLYLLKSLENLDTANHLSFYLRKPQKSNYPVLTYETVREITYKQKKIDVDIRSLLSIFNKFYDYPEELKPTMDRFTGSLMLLQDGSLWVMEHDEGNVMAMALTLTLNSDSEKDFVLETEDPLTVVYFFATQPGLRNMGVGQQLFKVLLHKFQKNNIVIKTIENEISSHLLEKYNFKKSFQFVPLS